MHSFETGRDSSRNQQSVKRCHHDHPPLEIGGGVVEGGACGEPNMKFDYLILLDDFQRGDFLPPWEGRFQIRFPIRDGGIPDVEKLKKLVDWVGEELAKGKKVHVGCFAGHGRTGTVLAAIVAKVLGEKDAIGWLRKNYCKKAVESKVQVDMLVKHFGVDRAEPSKPAVHTSSSKSSWSGHGYGTDWSKGDGRYIASRGKRKPGTKGSTHKSADIVTAEPRSGCSIFD